MHLKHFTFALLFTKGMETGLEYVLALPIPLDRSQASFYCGPYFPDENLNLYLLPLSVRTGVQSCQRAITGQVYQEIQQTVIHFLFIKYKQPTCLWMTVVLGRE